MNLKHIVEKGMGILQGKGSKENAIRKIQKLISETDLTASDLLDIIDGRLWEEECKKRFGTQDETPLWTMSEIEELYEDEIDVLNAKIEQLNRDKSFLEKTNANLNAKTRALSEAITASKEKNGNELIIYRGSERDLFDGEIQEIVLDTLEKGLEKTAPGSRRADVLQDILNSNKCNNLLKEKREKLKSALKTEAGVSDRVVAKLKDLGIYMESASGKHAKFSYYDDPRYQVTLSCSASDNRAGSNIVSTITTLMM